MKIILAVPVRYPEGFEEVEAEFIFDLAPHLATVATFAVHKDPSFSYYWNVTNVETGCHVGQHRTKAGSIRLAKEKLQRKTVDELLIAYRKAAEINPHLREMTA